MTGIMWFVPIAGTIKQKYSYLPFHHQAEARQALLPPAPLRGVFPERKRNAAVRSAE
jgi:hypothetical protein